MVRDIAKQRLRGAMVPGALCAIAVGAAGCSSESSRFGGGNPYAGQAAAYSAPLPVEGPLPAAAVPVHYSAVESRPLPQPGFAQAYGQASPAQQYAAAMEREPPRHDLPRAPRFERQAQAYAPPPPPRYEPGPPSRGEARDAYASPSAPRHEPRRPPRGEARDAYAPPVPHYEPRPSFRREERQAYTPPPAAPYEQSPSPRYEGRPAYAPPRPAEYSPPPGSPHSGARLSHATAPRAPVTSGPPSPRAAATDARAPVSPAPAAPSPAASAPAPAAPAQAALPAPAAAAGSGQTLLPTPPVYTVSSGDTLGRVAHQYHVTPHEIAVANGITPETPLRVGMRLTIPVRTVTFRPPRPQSGALAQARPGESRPQAPAPPAARVAAVETPPAASVHVMAAEVGQNGAPAFRWPARGRIINNYGARVNGSTNDGIDLAVPEGTPVRSADDGVVAYAGNELKGYGNLVLVRHANGFVTAYANGSELLVKRNDQVHKGQVVMKSGQTGNASVPQLHFEVRKNSAPVDPMQYLPSDRTASAPL
jgi:murein DD-endopeptidase MepM/ murein hydrolase activator NlpD